MPTRHNPAVSFFAENLGAAPPQVGSAPSLLDVARFTNGSFCDMALSDWIVGERHIPFIASPAKTKTPTVKCCRLRAFQRNGDQDVSPNHAGVFHDRTVYAKYMVVCP